MPHFKRSRSSDAGKSLIFCQIQLGGASGDSDPKTMRKYFFFQNLFGEVIKTVDTDQETEGLFSRPNSVPHAPNNIGQITHFETLFPPKPMNFG